MDFTGLVDLSELSQDTHIFKNSVKFEVPVHQIILNDMEIFNDIDKDLHLNSFNNKAISELESFRNFTDGFLTRKGIIYAKDYELFQMFPKFKYTTLAYVDADFIQYRFLLPIRLPSGMIYSYMAYGPNRDYNRYLMPKVIGDEIRSYSKQGNILGNLESINSYNSDTIYFTEGMFDAYRIEEQFKKPAVAILGSRLSRHKHTFLMSLKNRLKKKFVYVPDIDTSGQDQFLLNSKVWDDIFNFNKYFKTEKVYKDIDQYYRETKEYYKGR